MCPSKTFIYIYFFLKEAQKYTILVEVNDNGEKVQLSSTSTVIVNVMDKNNHLPEITVKTVSKHVPVV